MLPQELIDLVMDELASMDDRDALRNYISVSRAFHARARMHLFAHIEILIDDHIRTRKRAGRLRKILESNPDLQHGMRSFKMVITDPEKAKRALGLRTIGRFWQRSRDVAFNIGWKSGVFRVEKHLLWLLEVVSLIHVQRFSLVVLKTVHFDWDFLTEYQQSLLLNIRSSSRLETLELVNVYNLPATMIMGIPTADCTNPLRHLIFSQSMLRYQDLVQTPSACHPPLTCLTIGVIRHSVTSTWQFLMQFSQTVKYLELIMQPAMDYALLPGLSLKKMTALQELKFIGQAHSISQFIDQMYFITESVLPTVNPDFNSPSGGIRSLTIEFTLLLASQQERKRVLDPTHNCWSNLDQVLAYTFSPDTACSPFLMLDDIFLHLQLLPRYQQSQHEWMPNFFDAEHIFSDVITSMRWIKIHVDVDGSEYMII